MCTRLSIGRESTYFLTRFSGPLIPNTLKRYDGSEGEPAMQLNVPPDLETLINKRLSSGGYTNAEDVLRRALEAQDAEESWTDEERRALAAHIEEGYLQAERGELTDGAQARREIQAMKDDWRLSKR
jgi:Arc/MetJ-type ribon-helix-helix transcriptional regulator